MSKQFKDSKQEGELPINTPDNLEVKTGFFSGPGITNKPVEYVVLDGIALYEGCIELGKAEEVEQEAEAIRARLAQDHMPHGIHENGQSPSDLDGDVLHGVGLPQNSQYLWTNGVMPYTINSNLPNQARVTEAIQHWTANTGMRFVVRTSANASQYPNYVEFVRNPNANWSSSQIGMRGGRQLIRVSDAASAGTIIHEIGHAFGHYHEQSRSDRDLHVTIKWENIDPNFVGNFQKKTGSTDYYDYDYGSIMHYPTWAFSKNNQPTIVPVKSGVTIGQRQELSFGDRLSNAKMYERFFKKGHTGVWRQASGKYGLWVNASYSSFREKWVSWARQGLRLADVNVHYRNGQTRYSGVWVPGTGAYGLWVNSPYNTFREKWVEWAQKGLRLVDMNVHHVNGQNRYSGVWLPGTGAYGLWVNASYSSFREKWVEWAQKGLRLVDINVHVVNGSTRYSGVWLPGRGSYGLWVNATWSSFISKWKEWSNQGLRLVDINVHRNGSSNRYSGVFTQGSGGYYFWGNTTWENFRAKWQQLNQQGQRLIDYEFIHTGSGASYDPAQSSPKLSAMPDLMMDREEEQDGYGGIFGEEADRDFTTLKPLAEDSTDASASSEDGEGEMVNPEEKALEDLVGDFADNISDADDGSDEPQGELVLASENEKEKSEEADEEQGGFMEAGADTESPQHEKPEDENGEAVFATEVQPSSKSTSKKKEKKKKEAVH